MSNLYRGPSKNDLAKQFQRGRFFRNQPTRNKYYLWGSCVLTDWNEMSKLYRGLSIDFSYQVSVNLAKQIQRYSLKCEKDDRRRMPSDDKNSRTIVSYI